MPTLRIAAFTSENLFSRAKIIKFQKNENAFQPLNRAEELRAEVHKDNYDKPKILEFYHEIREFFEIVEVRERLFNRAKTKIIASLVGRCGAFIEFRREKFNEAPRENTLLNSFQALLSISHLTNALQAPFPDEPEKRRTYHFQKTSKLIIWSPVFRCLSV